MRIHPSTHSGGADAGQADKAYSVRLKGLAEQYNLAFNINNKDC